MTAAMSAPADWCAFVPGRIEVLGKHTDYAGGSSLTCATELGFRARFKRRTDGLLVLHDQNTGERFETSVPPTKESLREDWTQYAWVLAQRVARDLTDMVHGATVTWTSDLPRAAGLSSSSAFLIMLFLALRETDGLQLRAEHASVLETKMGMASYLAAVESGRAIPGLEGDTGVGTRGGAGDHTAILCSRSGRLGLYSYDPTVLERSLELPAGCVFAVADSGIQACKTGNAAASYNLATQLAATATHAWCEATGRDEPHFGAMLENASSVEIRKVLGAADSHGFRAEELLRRFDHFLLEETEVLPEAVEALAAADLVSFGRTVDRSQRAAEELLGNQIPETSFLQHSARSCGAHAASSFGAGFGGAVWALVDIDKVETFLARWSDAYRTQHPEPAKSARFMTTSAAAPASVRPLTETK